MSKTSPMFFALVATVKTRFGRYHCFVAICSIAHIFNSFPIDYYTKLLILDFLI